MNRKKTPKRRAAAVQKVKPIVKHTDCPICGGNGRMNNPEFKDPRIHFYTVPCTRCGGTGEA